MTRTEHNDENDTRKTIQRLAQLRAQKAKLLGFDTYAAYSLADQMAKTPENALKLLTDTVPAATAKAEGEIAEMQKVIDAQRSEEHTSELQSLMRISYAVFCLKKKKTHTESHKSNHKT